MLSESSARIFAEAAKEKEKKAGAAEALKGPTPATLSKVKLVPQNELLQVAQVLQFAENSDTSF